MKNFDHILLFKTNIQTHNDKTLIRYVLDSNDAIEKWSVDTEDVDCVLRIISYTLNHDEVTNIINSHGFECCELT